MAALRTIPDTRGGRLYRRVLLVLGISSIVGIADQLRALFWHVLAGPQAGAPAAAQRVVMLAGWAIMGWCGLRAIRRNALPPAWAAYAMPVLIWAYLLWPAG